MDVTTIAIAQSLQDVVLLTVVYARKEAESAKEVHQMFATAALIAHPSLVKAAPALQHVAASTVETTVAQHRVVLLEHSLQAAVLHRYSATTAVAAISAAQAAAALTAVVHSAVQVAAVLAAAVRSVVQVAAALAVAVHSVAALAVAVHTAAARSEAVVVAVAMVVHTVAVTDTEDVDNNNTTIYI